MLKTCSNREFLWSKEGEGVDLSMGEISLKNSHRSLRDLGFGVGERRGSLLGFLCVWNEVLNPHPEWVRGIYNTHEN
jgi:hypothetical protein